MKKKQARIDAPTFFINHFSIFRIIVALVLSILLILGIVYFVSDQPNLAIRSMILGPFQSRRAFFSVIERAVPIMFASLALNVVLASGVFNIGQDGSFYMGAVIGAFIAIKIDLPPIIHPLLAVILAAIVGGLISMLPVILSRLTNVSPVVLAIMFNSIFYYFGFALISNFLLEKGGSWGSELFPESAKFQRMITGTKMHWGFLILVMVYLFVIVLSRYSNLGYKIRMVGRNEEFAKTSGINTLKTVLIAQFIGGAIAGSGGAIEMLGSYQRFQWQGPVAFVWDGLMIHMLANENPIFIPLTTLFIAYLRVGSEMMSRASGIAPEIVSFLQGIVIVLVASDKFLGPIKQRFIQKKLESELE